LLKLAHTMDLSSGRRRSSSSNPREQAKFKRLSMKCSTFHKYLRSRTIWLHCMSRDPRYTSKKNLLKSNVP
jgi:hypothetical protein